MMIGSLGRKSLLWGSLLVGVVLALTACGTLQVDVGQTTATPGTPSPQVTPTAHQAPVTVEAATPYDGSGQGTPREAIAWYGQIHSVPGGDPRNDYLKPWHLNIWPKFGRAVGVAGADPAIDAEIDRIRDRDIRATFWGGLTCGVGDYGACQLLVTRISANDGGPAYDPEPVEGWEGTLGALPGPPGSQETVRYFVLAGEIPVLYGITSAVPSIQAELERLQDTGTVVRIWGELRSKAQPVTSTVIDVDRLGVVPATPAP